VIANEAVAAEPAAALSNSFAFGGLNAVLAFRRAD
jgi:3-oxoacyl-(acyl-carrier-protein) synthase